MEESYQFGKEVRLGLLNTVSNLLKLNFKKFTSRRPDFRRIYHQLDGKLAVHDVGRDGEGILCRVGNLNWAHIGL